MKKIISAIMCVLLLASVLAFAACGKEDDVYVPDGPTDVDYGSVEYVDYNDGTAVTFRYLDCFAASLDDEDRQDTAVFNTDDDKGVLSYEFFDSFKDYENSDRFYMVPSRKYAEIRAFSDDEAKDYLEVALGLVESQNVEFKTDEFKFEKNDNYVCLYMEVTAEYKVTGEIQKMWISKYVVENERVYTLHAFVPASCVTKYGPVFKDVSFDIENALTNGAK